jgi:hypothetical protein
MKRIIMIALALILCLSFVACNEEPAETTVGENNTTEAPALTDEPTAEGTEAAGTEAPAFDGYKVTVTDTAGNPIEGVQVQMCDSKGCRMPKATGADGVVTFTFDESDFHVLIAAAVEGYAVDTTEEYYFSNGSKELTIELEKAQ